MMRRSFLAALCLLLPMLPAALAGEMAFSLAGTWLDEELQDSVTDAFGGERKVGDIGIEGYLFRLEETPLAVIAEQLGAIVRRVEDGGDSDVWLCLASAEQAFYVYSHGLSEPAIVNKVVLDNRGSAPASAGCVDRDGPIVADLSIPAPGASMDEVQGLYGPTMPQDTGTFGYGSLGPREPGSERMTWQEIVYHTTDGVIDAYGVVQTTAD